jgi:peptidoglycan/LPS O-acetylase OafA/YrhL
MVLLYHYCAAFAAPAKSTLYYALLPTHLMWSGVDLFFVLSGYLIGGILLDQRLSPGYYRVFYLRRIHRIFPLYYLMAAALAVGLIVLPHAQLFQSHGIPFWVYPLYAQNMTGDFTRMPLFIGVTWSLAVEEQFYMLFPIIVRRTRNTLFAVLAVCVLGAPILRLAMINSGMKFEQVHPLLPCRVDSLALGVIAALLIRNESATAWIRRHRRICVVVCAVLALIAAGTLKWTAYSFVGTAGYSAFGLLYFLVLLLVVTGSLPAVSSLLRNPGLIWLATVSYCVYLIHQPVQAAIGALLPDHTLLRVLLALICTGVIAQISWKFLERGLIKRAHVRFRYESEPGTPARAQARAVAAC